LLPLLRQPLGELDTEGDWVVKIFFLRITRRVLQIAAILFAIFYAYGPSSSSFNVVFFIFNLVLAAIAAGLMILYRKIDQRVYDMEAIGLYKEIAVGHRETFSVFLRPFYVTNELIQTKSVSAFYAGSGLLPKELLRPPFYRLEVQLVEAMRRKSPVVGLGRPGEALGVGRILTNEEDWRAAATKLIDRAMYIFCIPSGRAGTLWEIDYVLEHHLLAKTIFIMPPMPNARKSIWRRKINLKQIQFGLEADWGNLIVEMKKRGLSFPQYERNGMLFRILSANSIETTPFWLSSPRSITCGIEDLMGDSPPASTPPPLAAFDLLGWRRKRKSRVSLLGAT
jgi:hypothetical protein